jgi:hypothetical protein
MKNQIIQKKLSLEILKERAARHFFKPFDKNIMFNGFKMSSFRCKSHVHAKKHVWLSIETLGLSRFFAFLALN